MVKVETHTYNDLNNGTTLTKWEEYLCLIISFPFLQVVQQEVWEAIVEFLIWKQTVDYMPRSWSTRVICSLSLIR